ncbi:MAG: UDP-N-acetylmuramate dehydrogenase [Porticoccaceae bacterium]
MTALAIVENVSLTPYTTLALPGEAEFFCRVESDEDLEDALTHARDRRLAITLLGGGSNTVVNGRVSGLVILMATRALRILAEDADSVTLRVAAGENWHELVAYCLARGWHGLENLALIPGSAGAAPVQNIGAYGVELASLLCAVEVVHCHDGRHQTLSAAECELRYRDSIFKHALRGKVVIKAIVVRLTKKGRANLAYPELANTLRHLANPGPQDVFEAVCALRRSKLPDPQELANAGSFFKNPVLAAAAAQRLIAQCPDIPRYPQADGAVKFPAAWLIDRAGWKGVRRGAVGVHDRQALVLVHQGGGTGAQLLALAAAIADDVRARYGVALEAEPVVVGDG